MHVVENFHAFCVSIPMGRRPPEPIAVHRIYNLQGQPGPPQNKNNRVMLTPEYLRRQAENCLRIARSCFDLASAERLRLMAAELSAKAAEIDEQDRDRRHSRAAERNPTS